MDEKKKTAGRRTGTAATDAGKKVTNTQSVYMFHIQFSTAIRLTIK